MKGSPYFYQGIKPDTTKLAADPIYYFIARSHCKSSLFWKMIVGNIAICLFGSQLLVIRFFRYATFVKVGVSKCALQWPSQKYAYLQIKIASVAFVLMQRFVKHLTRMFSSQSCYAPQTCEKNIQNCGESVQSPAKPYYAWL